MAVTIKYLARETGLTAATISAYFNGANVRPYNKEKIERAIDRLGYVRNDYARGLRTHRSMTIGVLIPELSNLFSTTIVSEMEEDLRKKGYGIIVCDCRSDAAREKESVRFLMSKMADGLIVIPVSSDGSAFTELAASGTPVVAIDRITDSKNISHIVINNREASKEAVASMINEGCKSIAIVCGETDVYTAAERFAGYAEAMEEAGLGEKIVAEVGHFSIDGGYRATKKLIGENPDTDGLFVTNYEMTVGAIIALKELGKEVGGDIAFMGFDNVEILKAVYPGIKTVSQPIAEIGRTAAETLLAAIEGAPVSDKVLKAKMD